MKDFLKYFLTLVLVLGLTIGAYSIGANIASGKSAYDIAVENGYDGTVEQWLMSLKGVNGKDAPLLQSLYAVAQDEGFEGDIYAFVEDKINIDEIDDSVYSANKAITSVVSVVCEYHSNSVLMSNVYNGVGSGVLYRVDKSSGSAYVITNYHVVFDNASIEGVSQNIKVYLYGMEYAEYAINAEFVAGSNQNDIAVLKIDNADILKTANVNGVDGATDISLGEMAIAIGNPSAEGISVTKGVVSKLDEYVTLNGADESTITLNVVRIDAPINAGNSGGGLFNKKGELIGIVNAKIIDQGIEGIGFALPSTNVLPLVDCIIDTAVDGIAYKCVLGVGVKVASSKTLYDYDTLTTDVIEQIIIESSTNKCLQEGDIIVSVNLNNETTNINKISDLKMVLFKSRQGDNLIIKVMRENQLVEVTCEINNVQVLI